MVPFTIDDENNITVFASAEEAAQAGGATAIQFDSQAALGKVSADWPLSRFVEIWNSISGNRQVNKFADRKKVVARIWAAIQPIAERAVASQPQEPKPAKPGKGAKPAKKTKAARKAAPERRFERSARSAGSLRRASPKPASFIARISACSNAAGSTSR